MISIQKRKLPCSCSVWLHLAYKFTKRLIGWSGKHYGTSSLICKLVQTTCLKSFKWSQHEISFKLELKQTWKMWISVVKQHRWYSLSMWFHSGSKQAKPKALTLAYFMNLYSLIKKKIQNNLFNHFCVSGNLLNSGGLTKLQTQLISLFHKILLVEPGISDSRNSMIC